MELERTNETMKKKLKNRSLLFITVFTLSVLLSIIIDKVGKV